MEESAIRARIEELVAEEHRLLHHEGEGPDPERHARLKALKAELDSAWDLLRRRQAGLERLEDADVPAPPNELDGPDPEPPHYEHNIHERY
jgi:hypothetical protein